MIIPKVLTALLTIYCLAGSPSLAAESFDIDLKELRPAPAAKPAPKQQNLEIDLKELKAVKEKKSKPKKAKRKTEPKVTPETVPEPVTEKIEPEKVPDKTVEVPLVNVNVTYVEACGLARQVAEKLGLLVPPTLGDRVFTARYKDASVTVACEPSPAELITYGRLLSMRGEQLLVLAGTDSSRVAIEKLAISLGLSFKATEVTKPDSLPQEYLFEINGSNGRQVRLIIDP